MCCNACNSSVSVKSSASAATALSVTGAVVRVPPVLSNTVIDHCEYYVRTHVSSFAAGAVIVRAHKNYGSVVKCGNNSATDLVSGICSTYTCTVASIPARLMSIYSMGGLVGCEGVVA